jgi:hypothetical protein
VGRGVHRRRFVEHEMELSLGVRLFERSIREVRQQEEGAPR